MTQTFSVSDHFVNKDPLVRALYDQLLSLLRTIGPIEEDPKKTSIHHKVRISSPADFDEELKTWLKEAYLLSE